VRLSSSSLRLGIFAACIAAAGCGSSDELGEAPPPQGVPGVDASIRFAHEGTLPLAPRESATIEAIGAPPAPYAMSFLLVGDSLDASLDRTSAVAGADGRASVTLLAPNAATTFRLRATIKSGPSAELQIAVSGEGFGTIVVVPENTSQRPVLDGWEARVVSGTSCEALAGTFPEDPEGALAASAAADESPVIELAPVGPNLSVFLRAGHYMWGCTDEPDLVANETKEVTVHVVPKPIDSSRAELDVLLGFVPEQAPWDALVQSHLNLMIDTFFGGLAVDPAQALLNAMEALAPDAQEFADASVQNAWYDAVQQHLGTHQIDMAQTIADLAFVGLVAQPPEIVGELHATSRDMANFTLGRFGNVTPEELAVPSVYSMSLTVEPDDTARLGGTLSWLPSRYIGHSVEAAGLVQYPMSASFAAVLGEVAMCEQLDLPGLTSCDTSCIKLLCRQALAASWADAIDASASNALWGEIALQASGPSSFDDFAALTGFEGSWLGNATDGMLEAKVSGTVQAEPLGPSAR
jgi:hypothetical protein